MNLNKLKTLQTENAALKAKVTQLEARIKNATTAYDQLAHQIKQLTRARFGSQSERFVDSDDPQQSLLADESSMEEESSDDDENNDQVVSIKAYRRKKKAKSNSLPKRIVIIPVADKDKHCHCGRCKVVINYANHEYYHFQPAVFELIEEKREIMACPRGCEGSVITADKPKHVLPKIKASIELLSHVIVSKVVDRQPLYHLEKQFSQRYQVDISRRTMASWMIDLRPELQPLANLFKDHIISYDIAALDATTFQVLKEPGRPATTKSYAYCFRGGPPDKQAVIYEYNAQDHKPFVANWFAGFQGKIHSDADPFFEMLADTPGITMSYCNAHARRKFEPIAKAVKEDGLAKHAMKVYRSLYKIEREAKDKHLTPDERYQLRQQKSKPILDELKGWLDDGYPTVLPKSPLGGAIKYCIKHWNGLVKFLDDGRLEIDNNLTEQAIKPFVMARKNFLFADSVAGAKALCMHFSITRTAILHGFDPYHYYVAALKALPYCQTIEDYEALLPWNLKLTKATSLSEAA